MAPKTYQLESPFSKLALPPPGADETAIERLRKNHHVKIASSGIFSFIEVDAEKFVHGLTPHPDKSILKLADLSYGVVLSKFPDIHAKITSHEKMMEFSVMFIETIDGIVAYPFTKDDKIFEFSPPKAMPPKQDKSEPKNTISENAKDFSEIAKSAPTPPKQVEPVKGKNNASAESSNFADFVITSSQAPMEYNEKTRRSSINIKGRTITVKEDMSFGYTNDHGHALCLYMAERDTDRYFYWEIWAGDECLLKEHSHVRHIIKNFLTVKDKNWEELHRIKKFDGERVRKQ